MRVKALTLAKQMGRGRFKDATWRDVDCSMFCTAVLEEQVRVLRNAPEYSLPRELRRRCLIAGIAPDDLGELISDKNSTVGGVPAAIVVADYGDYVEPEGAKPGDYVQWWKRDKGRWRGHAFFVAEDVEIRRSGVVLCRGYGSHKTINGIGVHPRQFALTDTLNRRVWIARLDPERVAKRKIEVVR